MIRKAKLSDAKQIKAIIDPYAKIDLMLGRSLNNIYETIRDFYVYTSGKEIIGTCALHIFWEDLGEVRSVAVKNKYQKHGIGTKLVKEALKEAEELKLKKIFTLTYFPGLFKRLGFKRIDKKELPQKIWSECINCVKFPDCTETALIYKVKVKS